MLAKKIFSCILGPSVRYVKNVTFICIKRHLPMLSPRRQLINITLKYAAVFHGFYLPIQDTIVSKKTYIRLKLSGDVIDIDQEKERPKYSSLWNTREDWCPIRLRVAQRDTLPA